MKKEILRRCIANNAMFPKNKLLRIVLTKDGQIIVDKNNKINGHGAYVLKDLPSVEKLIKTKALNRIFKKDIPSIVYEEIREAIKDE